MPRPTDIQIRDLRTGTEQIAYRTPMKFGGRVVTDVVLLHVWAEVETRDGRRGTGFGSMPMGNVWAWPTTTLSGAQTLDAMLVLGQQMVDHARAYHEFAHPLRMTTELAQGYSEQAAMITTSKQFPEPMPRLAQLLAASPLEAALHDAQGKAIGQNSYNLLGPEHVDEDLSFWLGATFAGEYLDAYTTRTPNPTMPLYHLVGALDPLTAADQPASIDDGLPETLTEWIRADGLSHMKIKLNGDDIAWDVARVVAIDRVATESQAPLGRSLWYYSLDFNERCPNVEYVLDFLAQLSDQAPLALTRVQYIEQPTHRDLRAHPENRMHAAAKIKPVVIDESLLDYESLLLAQEQGYSGVALKACKGHTEALLMGAAAQKHGLFLCVQDLTCPGASFLHSASISCRIPTVAAIEGNGRQYCPAGNLPWAQRFPGMFQITDGQVQTRELSGVGLGGWES